MRSRLAFGVALALAAIGPTACGHAEPKRPAGGGATDRATVMARRQVAPRIVDLTVRSPALGRTAKVRLLTPKGWGSRRKGQRWPVLYLLHGCCDTYDSWTRETRIESMRPLRGVLVVMPEAGDVGFYSDWRNDGRGGPPAWERFHLVELRRLLERGYGAGTRRAVAGLSMGGLGAMAYAARHPGLFAAAASFSGLLHPLADTRLLLGLFSNYAPDPQAIWGEPAAQRKTWAAHDPTALASRLRGTRLFVSSGDGRPGPFDRAGRSRDGVEATVYRESRAFATRLRGLDVPATIDFYGRGIHDWPYWERELRRSLSLLL
jgi:diacylglycerol O-acyltransferase / trehalose O-mycolyltransferase / mycolyltransferase Ag85